MGRSKQSGFTMIEILIAIVVLVVGLVGILVLFPVGIDAARRAAQDSTSGVIAESVEEALKDALRGATATGGNLRARLIHAGAPGMRYEFSLPRTVDVSPSATGEAHPTDNSTFSYRASDIGYTEAQLSRDPYSQYSYNFSVIRRSSNLYEFWIRVYRNFPQRGTEEQRSRTLIREYSCMISTPFSTVY